MKKRLLALTLALLLLLTACVQAGPAPSEPSQFGKDGQTTAYFKLVDVDGDGALGLKVLEDGSHEPLYWFSTAGAENLRPGMVVEVAWNGLVMDSYPAILSGVTALRVAEQQDDLVGLYRQVLDDLWADDSGLNHDAELLGLDFSTLTNLTEGEKAALEYLFSGDVGLFGCTVTGTWQELCDAGYIDGEDLYWEDGVFLSIALTGEGDGTFTFDAQKWRSGLGAIWYGDCTAKAGKDGSWSYAVGSFAIA